MVAGELKRALKIGGQRRQQKRRSKLDSRSINLNRDYSNSNGFVKCRLTFLELNSLEPCPSSEREFCPPLYTSSIKRENRHFHVVVVQ